MSKPELSSDFLKELGLMPLSLRQELGLHKQVERLSEPEVEDEAPVDDVRRVIMEAMALEGTEAAQTAMVERDADLTDIAGEEVGVDEQPVFACDLLLLANDLSHFWENESSPEWRLWQAILQAFNWQSLRVEAYDLANYVSEAACFELLDQVMASGIERVFAFSQDGCLLLDMLAEGLEVVHLPIFSVMLQQPEAKKACFLTLSQQ